jgi:lysyl-tRNA synthetase class 2
VSTWRPSSGADTARRRAALLARARAYFAEADVLEVTTPALGRYAASDPNVDGLTAASRSGRRYFLHTSPEFCMKRLLAAGYPDIYSIGPVYRDGELGRRHVPEFTMLEWYRRGFGLGEIIADTTRLIAACLDAPALSESAAVIDYADACRDFANVDPFDAPVDELAAGASADSQLRDALGDDRDAWLDLLVSTVVAPQLPSDRLTVIRHYPASQAALARLCPGEPRVADRFEVFCGDMELANGYVELTDAGEQRRRIEADLDKRRRTGRDVHPWDRTLIAALEAGLPDCAGVAVGIERLHMLLEKSADIRNVMTFAFGTDDD